MKAKDGAIEMEGQSLASPLPTLSLSHTLAGDRVQGSAWCSMKGRLQMSIVILCCEADKEEGEDRVRDRKVREREYSMFKLRRTV